MIMETIHCFTGQFGKVYKAILRNSEGETIHVAMKTTKAYSKGEMKNFEREMAIMSKMMHPNIVQLYGLVQEGNDTFTTIPFNDKCKNILST